MMLKDTYFTIFSTFLAVCLAVSGTAASSVRRDDDDSRSPFRGGRIERPGDFIYVSGVLTSGARFESGEGLRPSIGILASFELDESSLKAIVEEVDLGISPEYEVSPSDSYSLVIECLPRQDGVVTWTPYFNLYDGFALPSGETGDVWIPSNTTESRTNFDFNCLG